MTGQNEKVDVLAVSSDKDGFSGFVELFFRRFRTISFMMMCICMLVVYALSIGISITPGILITRFIYSLTLDYNYFLQSICIGIAVGTGFLLYGLSIIFVVPFFNFLNPFKLKPYRGPWFSVESLGWTIHNSLNYLVRYTFLEFITPSPLNILYFKLMGMKIGKGVIINSSNISEPCLIELGDYVTIAGSATIFAHYAQKGYIVCAPVIIKKGATIGLKASVMGSVEIGQNATVAPHAIVYPKTVINDNEVYPNPDN